MLDDTRPPEAWIHNPNDDEWHRNDGAGSVWGSERGGFTWVAQLTGRMPRYDKADSAEEAQRDADAAILELAATPEALFPEPDAAADVVAGIASRDAIPRLRRAVVDIGTAAALIGRDPDADPVLLRELEDVTDTLNHAIDAIEAPHDDDEESGPSWSFEAAVTDHTPIDEVLAWAAPAEADEKRCGVGGPRCEGCEAPATCRDPQDVPLCDACADDLEVDLRGCRGCLHGLHDAHDQVIYCTNPAVSDGAWVADHVPAGLDDFNTDPPEGCPGFAPRPLAAAPPTTTTTDDGSAS